MLLPTVVSRDLKDGGWSKKKTMEKMEKIGEKKVFEVAQ